MARLQLLCCDPGYTIWITVALTGEEIPRAADMIRPGDASASLYRSHSDYVVEAILQVWEQRASVTGYRFVEQAPLLRHFMARFDESHTPPPVPAETLGSRSSAAQQDDRGCRCAARPARGQAAKLTGRPE